MVLFLLVWPYLLYFRHHFSVSCFFLFCAVVETPSKTCGFGETEVFIKGQTSGRFHHPGWPNSYEADIRCLYRFTAPPGRKILVKFIWFHVAGLSPLWVLCLIWSKRIIEKNNRLHPRSRINKQYSEFHLNITQCCQYKDASPSVSPIFLSTSCTFSSYPSRLR